MSLFQSKHIYALLINLIICITPVLFSWPFVHRVVVGTAQTQDPPIQKQVLYYLATYQLLDLKLTVHVLSLVASRIASIKTLDQRLH